MLIRNCDAALVRFINGNGFSSLFNLVTFALDIILTRKIITFVAQLLYANPTVASNLKSNSVARLLFLPLLERNDVELTEQVLQAMISFTTCKDNAEYLSNIGVLDILDRMTGYGVESGEEKESKEDANVEVFSELVAELKTGILRYSKKKFSL